MKRLFLLFVAIVAMVALLGLAIHEPKARLVAPTQFQGYVTYQQTGGPAPAGTLVRAFLDDVEKGRTTISGSYGYYGITGDDEDFPTGTYLLRADDGVWYGTNNCSHTQGTTSDCDIVLKWTLP
jgi:hypothetical protein